MRNRHFDIVIALLLNPSLMVMSLALEFVICMFYLGAEPDPDRMMWLFNASFRLGLSVIAAAVCTFVQYRINRLLLLPHLSAGVPLLKRISVISFVLLSAFGLYMAVRFYLSWGEYYSAGRFSPL